MKEFFKNKNILVTGAGGSIGTEICKTLLTMDIEQVKCFDNSEYSLYRLSKKLDDPRLRYLIGDVRDKERLDRAVTDADIVIHAAALKHVYFCEFNPDEAYKTNVLGTQNIIDVCRKHNPEHCILISTDKSVNPSSVMGTTKLLAEKLFINAPERGNNNTSFTVVRFGNVFGSAGSVIETFYNQIKNKKQITLTEMNISRYFMSISEACRLVLNCVSETRGNYATSIFILKMKKAKIKRIAERLNFILNGKASVDFKIIGLQNGEKIDEKLFTDLEYSNIIEMKDYYVISNNKNYNKTSIPNEFMNDKEIDELINAWLEKEV